MHMIIADEWNASLRSLWYSGTSDSIREVVLSLEVKKMHLALH